MVYFGEFFPQTGIFAGFSLHIINLAVRISAAVMTGAIILFSIYVYIIRQKEQRNCDWWAVGGGGGGIVFFTVPMPSSLEGCDGWGESGEYYLSKPRWYSGKIYTPGSRLAHLG